MLKNLFRKRYFSLNYTKTLKLLGGGWINKDKKQSGKTAKVNGAYLSSESKRWTKAELQMDCVTNSLSYSTETKIFICETLMNFGGLGTWGFYRCCVVGVQSPCKVSHCRQCGLAYSTFPPSLISAIILLRFTSVRKRLGGYLQLQVRDGSVTVAWTFVTNSCVSRTVLSHWERPAEANHLYRMHPGRLLGMVFWACPTKRGPQRRTRTHWRFCVFNALVTNAHKQMDTG